MRKKPLLIKIRLEKVILLVKCWSKKKKEKRGFTCDRTKKKENWVWEGGSMIEE